MCVYMQIYQSQWKCSKYMVCLCSNYAKINGDVLSICPLDVLRLRTFSHVLSIVSVYVLSKGLNKWENDVLSISPSI